MDDTPANLRLLVRMLSEQNYAVMAANSGAVALQVMETALPDIVLLDVKMPEMDGYEVCRCLKADPRTCDIPVIFISALDAAWDKVRAFTVGGVDYIVKPIEPVEVLARVETHLSLNGLRRQLEQRVEERTADLLMAKEALFESKALLQAIIDTSTTIIYVKDLDGCYMLVNRRFEELFGGPDRNLLGLTDDEIFPPEIAKALRAIDEQIIASGAGLECEEVLPHGDELHTYILVTSPLRDLTGEVYAICAIATDITDRQRDEEILRELNEMLESRLAERHAADEGSGT
ncbi:response regulator [Noviherbaspirillum saxi]|uniref:response regulator n=1 Tax=Noviherbaspirillum saxi TaxID=2320863 RepID=UPI001314E4B2|nr:response regulator [Noviherbaspirillum saxi]